MLDLVPSRRDLRIISEAINRPGAFFEWVRAECRNEAGTKVIDAAQKYLPVATWGWDKATILAGAYLAVLSEAIDLPPTEGVDTGFPLWVALDKHTPEGKLALHMMSAKLNEPYRKLIWASFYFESAVVNALNNSPWFEAERNWRLRKTGLSPTSAKNLWDRVRPLLESQLAVDSAQLLERVSCKA